MMTKHRKNEKYIYFITTKNNDADYDDSEYINIKINSEE